MSEKILVVDDHTETLNLVSVILRRQGYEVHTANSGPLGLEIAAKEYPHLILLDVMMPDMDGYEVCRRIRQDDHLKEIPVILFTAKSRPSEKWEGFQAGATDYLVKPTNTEELGKRVRMILDNTPRPLGDDDQTTVVNEAYIDRPADSEPGIYHTGALQLSILLGVIGVRGGSGTTTTAVNLAYLLAQQEQKVLLADLDIHQGHVGMYLNRQTSGGLNALATTDVDYIWGEMNDQLINYTPTLSLLLSQPNLIQQQPMLTPAQMPFLVEALVKKRRIVVADLGQGITALNQPFLEKCQGVIVCLRPERIAVSAAKQLINRLKRTLPQKSQIYMIMLDFGQGTELPRKAVESFIGHRLYTSLTIPPRDMTQAVNEGKPLAVVHPTMMAMQKLQQLASAIFPVQTRS